MKNNWIRFIQDKNLKLFVGVVVLVTLVGIFLYGFVGKLTEINTAEQMLHREQIITRAGAKSIRAYINLTKRSLLNLSRSLVLNLNSQTQTALDDFVNDWQGSALVEAIIIDNQGKIQNIASQEITDSDLQIDFSDRDYFIWSKTAQTGEVYVGDPIQARLGKYSGEYIITITTPLIKNGQYQGALVSALLVSRLTENFLNPLKISDQSKIYLLDSQGKVVYSDITALIGENVLEYLEDQAFLGSKQISERAKAQFAHMESQPEGKLIYHRYDYGDNSHLRKWLLAYSRIDIASTGAQKNWLLIAETPYTDALLNTASLFQSQNISLVFFLLIVSLLSVLGLYVLRLSEKNAYLKGFAQGRKNK